jgi:hypothetical protein
VAEAATGHAGTAGEAAEALAYGLTAGDLRDWAPFSPVEIYWALRHDLTRAVARRWAREGLRVGDAVRAIALGMVPEEVTPWADAGFAPRTRSTPRTRACRSRPRSPGGGPGSTCLTRRC